MEYMPHMPASLQSVYLVGGAVAPSGNLQGFVDAVNYIRGMGVPISVGAYSASGDKAKIPIAIRCDRPSQLSSTKEAISRVLDNCDLQLHPLTPRASDPKSIKIAEKIDAVDCDRRLTLDDISPRVIEGDPFSGLVGMDAPIACARRLVKTWKAFGKDSLHSIHTVLSGPSGTGKTTFATRFARYLRSEGLITGGIREVSAAELIGRYVGETPHLIKEQFLAADGGILFIDEAYSLVDSKGGYGVEAVDALVELMDSNAGETIVIAAGYPEPMKRFLESNEGLRSRFALEIEFKDYTSQQLSDIYKSFAHSKRFMLDPFDEDLLAECKKLPQSEGYASARSVRKLFDESVIVAATRHPSQRVITEEDFRIAVSRNTGMCKPGRVIGFS